MHDLGLELICCDELEHLERLMASLRGLELGDRVAAWSGEDRRVKELLEGHGFRVLSIVWPGRFDVARTIIRNCLRTPWALWLDSDDTLEGAGELEGVFEEVLRYGHRGAAFHYSYTATEKQIRERILKVSETRWVGAIHEGCEHQDSDVTYWTVPAERIAVRHHGGGVTPEKHLRNVRIAEAQSVKTHREWWALAEGYYVLGDIERSIGNLWQFIWSAPNSQYHYSGLMFLARILVERGDLNAAIRVAQHAASIIPWSSEPPFLVAEIYHTAGHHRQALKCLVDGFARRLPQNWPLPIDQRRGNLFPRRLYAQVLVELDWSTEAFQVLHEAREDFPGDSVLQKILDRAVEKLKCQST